MRNSKLVTLEEAIKRSGLKDGMTISFHHHFRGGDKVVNLVVDKLAQMGFKDLKLAASSLSAKNFIRTRLFLGRPADFLPVSGRPGSSSVPANSQFRIPSLISTAGALADVPIIAQS